MDCEYKQAVELVLKHKRPSARFLKEKMDIGSQKASRLMQHMESAGIVGPIKNKRHGSGGYRQLLVTS